MRANACIQEHRFPRGRGDLTEHITVQPKRPGPPSCILPKGSVRRSGICEVHSRNERRVSRAARAQIEIELYQMGSFACHSVKQHRPHRTGVPAFQ